MSQCVALLHAGWMGNLTSLGTLQTMAGLTNQDAAKLCGIAAETYRRWRTDRTPPLYAFRLLSIRAGYVPWPGWGKWFYNRYDQSLVHVDLKEGFFPRKSPNTCSCGSATRKRECGLQPRNSQQTRILLLNV